MRLSEISALKKNFYACSIDFLLLSKLYVEDNQISKDMIFDAFFAVKKARTQIEKALNKEKKDDSRENQGTYRA